MEIKNKETTIKAIKAIGQDLINKSEEICNDLNYVNSITIYALLSYGEVVNFDITKNYAAKNIGD